ncbi:MAG TPA: MFS transporter [Candidatus Acidoferrum sp.]
MGIERNVFAASGAIFLVGLGEELWKKFLPKYLESLGASVAIVGLFGTAEDFFDALYQYPGGWLADYWGRRKAFLTFLLATAVGYIIYLFSPAWPYLFLGLAFVMVWQTMASPTIFATIADALPKDRHAMGFTVYSVLKRIPVATSPLVGGVIMGAVGLAQGVRMGLLVTLVLAGCSAMLLLSLRLAAGAKDTIKIGEIWDSFHRTLKRLLASDIVIRVCEGMADIFVVLYVTNVSRITLPEYGVLISIQLMTSILIYLPSGKVADRVGKKPLVVATFLCFAFYPIAVILANNFRGLVFAFILGGLREIGEPSRKAMIVGFAQPQLRARTVGLYYLVRSLSITPASVIGGLLWKVRPETPFVIAGIVGALGTLLFALTVEEQNGA